MKPILFNTEMARAILDGRKTVTRRVLKPQPSSKMFTGVCTDSTMRNDPHVGCFYFGDDYGDGKERVKPPCQPGEILYVRETCYLETFYCDPGEGAWVYKADNEDYPVCPGKWRPSIHMPKEAARIFLRVTSVRVERLQDITPNDIDREGTPFGLTIAPYDGFSRLWDSTIKPADLPTCGWDANPWVWVVEFERCEKPGDAKQCSPT